MTSPVEVADVVELRAWGSGQSITISQLEADIETSIPDEAIDLQDGDAGEPYEVLAQQVFDELTDRQQKIGTSYPFACDGYRLRYYPTVQPPSAYIFCLLLSYLPADVIDNEQRALQFETVVMDAAKNFFGGSALRIGWPWERATYVQLLEDVLLLLPNLGQVNLPEPVSSGDRGWDILVVKGFQDGHYPKLIVLGNCATGRSNWKMKGMETQPDFFWRCFQHQLPGTLLTFSAVPFHMDADARGRKASASNLTFDRYRISEHAGDLPNAARLWCDQQQGIACDVPLDATI